MIIVVCSRGSTKSSQDMERILALVQVKIEETNKSFAQLDEISNLVDTVLAQPHIYIASRHAYTHPNFKNVRTNMIQKTGIYIPQTHPHLPYQRHKPKGD